MTDRSIDWLEIGDMDWCFSKESDDFIVPNNLETSDVLCEDDRSLLSNEWLQWGVTTAESFKTPNKRSSSTAIEPTKEFDFGNSDPSGTGSGFSVGRPDYQLQNLCQSIKSSCNFEEMDDIYLNSILEEDSPDMEVEYPYRHERVGIFLNIESSSMPVVNLLTGILLDSQNIGKNPSCMGSSKYVKKSSFPIETEDFSDDWDKKEEFPPSHFSPSDYERMEGSPTEKVTHSEEESLEEAVLQELKDTMSQLNQETRLCFRDALYRLARSSEQRQSADNCSPEFIVEDPSVASVQNKGSRCSNSSMKSESESNAIDRTIMKLLFQKLNCDPEVFCA